jgi:hypothetical protein
MVEEPLPAAAGHFRRLASPLLVRFVFRWLHELAVTLR